MTDLEIGDRELLERQLRSAEDELAELEAERQATLGGTGVHLGAERAAFLREEFEREATLLREKINHLRQLLAQQDA